MFYPESTHERVDILFVIDNSASMAQHQQNLIKNFNTLIDALKSTRRDQKLPNLHIGVVSTDLGAGNWGAAIPSCETPGGDRGELQHTARIPGCPTPTDPWISYAEGAHNIPCTNADPMECVKEAFTCIAALGSEGCRFKMPMESARLALDISNDANPGFLRDDALLMVVFITDEDDCSAAKPQLFDPTLQGLSDPLGPLTSFRCFEFGVQCDINDRNMPGPRANCVPAYDWLHNVDHYIRFFGEFKGTKHRVLMTAIAGPKEPVAVGLVGNNPTLMPSCRLGESSARPALRLAKLVEAFGGAIHTLCTDDFGPALRVLDERVIGSPPPFKCITTPILLPKGGVACKAGVDVCKMPSCLAGTTCDMARGVCVTTEGEDTSRLCGESCLDKADCELRQVSKRGTAEETELLVERCPRELFEPSIPKEQCGGSCPCWRIVPREHDCTRELGVSPFAFEIMRMDQPPSGTVTVARCRVPLFDWYDSEVQQASDHCSIP
ncbi:MAG: hypothetical protein JRH20_25805 [Deltaproteobacteria bacterium]|nr:hypothetical protein [Deltaproteobacteria bacterium]